MDKRITKEWNRIKDYNIFNDIDEFALLFLEKPYGVCYDGESGYSRKHISIAYIYEQCKKIYLLGSMPDVFLQRLKKLILYIEYPNTVFTVKGGFCFAIWLKNL